MNATKRTFLLFCLALAVRVVLVPITEETAFSNLFFQAFGALIALTLFGYAIFVGARFRSYLAAVMIAANALIACVYTYWFADYYSRFGGVIATNIDARGAFEMYNAAQFFFLLIASFVTWLTLSRHHYGQ